MELLPDIASTPPLSASGLGWSPFLTAQDCVSTASTLYDSMLLPFVTHIIAMTLSSASSSTSLSAVHTFNVILLACLSTSLYLMTVFRFIAFYCISYCTYTVHSDTARLVSIALMTCNALGCCFRLLSNLTRWLRISALVGWSTVPGIVSARLIWLAELIVRAGPPPPGVRVRP